MPMAKKKTAGKIPSTGLKLFSIHPLTNNQKVAFEEYQANQNLFLHGVAGTGKTFVALYLALNEVLSGLSDYFRVVIVRSAVASRDIGFLPGNVKDKIKEFEAPYVSICTDLFGRGDAYQILKDKKIVEFTSTSFIRGITLRDTIVIIDEIQNYTFHEASSVLTRIGKNCRVMVAGDFRQSDLFGRQRAGLSKLISVAKDMPSFSFVEFGINDIVRSGFVREFLISCLKYEDEECHTLNMSYGNGIVKSPPLRPNGAGTIIRPPASFPPLQQP